MNLNNFSNLFKEAAKMSKSLAGSAVKAGVAISNGKPIIAQKNKAQARACYDFKQYHMKARVKIQGKIHQAKFKNQQAQSPFP